MIELTTRHNTSGTSPAIEVRDLSKRFGATVAVAELSFTFRTAGSSAFSDPTAPAR
jgi:hypothetical protein